MNYESMTVSQISKATGISVGALQSRIYRAGMTKTEAVAWKGVASKKWDQVLREWHNFDINLAHRYSLISIRKSPIEHPV